MTWALKQKVKKLEDETDALKERNNEQQDQINALRDDVKMLLERNGLVSTMFLVSRE